MVQYRLGGGAPAGYPQSYFGGGMAQGGPVMRRAMPYDGGGQMVNGPGSGFGPGSVEDPGPYQGIPAWAHQPAYAGGGYPQMPGYPGHGGLEAPMTWTNEPSHFPNLAGAYQSAPPPTPGYPQPQGGDAMQFNGPVPMPYQQHNQAPTMAYGGARPAPTRPQPSAENGWVGRTSADVGLAPGKTWNGTAWADDQPSIQHPQVPLAHQVNPMVWDSLGPVGQELARGAIAQTGQDVGQYEYDMNRARPQGYAGQAPVNRYRPQQRSFSGF